MKLIVLIFLIVSTAIKVVIITAVVLMILRLIVQLANPNPFGWITRTTRQLTDVFVDPMRRNLLSLGADPKFAPLIVILVTILLGYFALSFVQNVLWTILGSIAALDARNFTALLGVILYGLLSIYSLMILVRIIFSWARVGYSNPIMRILIRTTDPLLDPLRRLIPPLGMFDL